MYFRHSYPVVVKDHIEIFQMYRIDGAGHAPSLYTVLGDHQPFVRLRSEGYGVVSFVCLGPNLLLVQLN